MRALVWRSKTPGDIAVEEVPEPVPEGREALIRVGCSGICGSDITITSGAHPRAKPPLVLGHEFMGRVASLPAGERAAELSLGQRVVVEPLLSCGECRPCREGHGHVCERLRLLGVETDGGFAELAKAPVSKVYPIPDTVSDEEGALIEPLAVAVHSVNYARAAGGDAAAVIGAGPVGLLIAQVLRARGVSRVWLFEVDGYRRALAERLGFEAIDPARFDMVEESRARTGGGGADITFDAAGAASVGPHLIPMTGIRGRIVMTALHKKPCEVWFRDLAYREQTIVGIRIYARGDFPAAIGLAAAGEVSLKPLISGVHRLEEARTAFEAASGGKSVCKLLLKP